MNKRSRYLQNVYCVKPSLSSFQAETSVAGSDDTDSDESNAVKSRVRRSSRSSAASLKQSRKTKHYISLRGENKFSYS